ncbi:MAG TPA: HEAT repeat domain-containing protein, partial [Pirellulales bacterium]
MQTTPLLRWLSRIAPAAGLALVAGSPDFARADVFELASGGRVVGDLLNEKEVPRQTYEVKTPLGIVVSLDRAAVRKQEKQRPALEEYAEIKPTYPDTVAGQLKLAEWCRSRHLYAQRTEHIKRVVELDPTHVEARRILGHVKIDGNWVSPDQAMAARGYVEFKGRWRLPQEIEAMQLRVSRDKAEREWFAKIERWKTAMIERNSAEDRKRISSIDDPLALRALRQKLTEEPNRDIRVLYLEAINTIGGPAANELLAVASLRDYDQEVRLSALDYLEKTRPPEVVFIYMKALRNSDATIINRAGYYLGALGSDSAVPSLIDALVTQHKFKVTYGAPGAGNSGMG